MNEIIQDLLIDLPKAPPNKLELLIKRAINQINNYLNKEFNESDSIKNFKYAIEQIVLDTYLYQQSKQYKDGVVRLTEGERSIEYKSTSSTGRIVFTNEVKSMLPTPYVRLMG
ncbi:hypothetical protein [Clostridium perfringens]|uniref:Phage gp6-like head-tail connector protein n=1 Tax=Clostridium perfringens TaxID=1502 RepID=A0ABD4PS84_CLOPF|nr:hypothetical protein [Clostridium perfringens]MBO3417909.1 hypothetical protein [Clostridium perfringens]